VRHGEDQPAAGTQHPGALEQRTGRVRDEGDRPEGAHEQVEGRSAKGQPLQIGLHEPLHPYAGGGVEVPGLLQLPGGDVEGRHACALRDQPARGLRGAAADLQHVQVTHLAEQVRVGLAEPFRAPQQVRVVVRRVGVPPVPVRPGTLSSPRSTVDHGGVRSRLLSAHTRSLT